MTRRSSAAPSQRQLRVGELIRRVLAETLMRGATHDPALEGLSLTVGEVRASPDLRRATVYVMPLGGAAREEALEALARARGGLRRAVMREVRMKQVPELVFVIDESYDRMDETRALFEDPAVRRDLEGD